MQSDLSYRICTTRGSYRILTGLTHGQDSFTSMTRFLKSLAPLVMCAAAIGGGVQAAPTVFINEIHYDNTGTVSLVSRQWN